MPAIISPIILGIRNFLRMIGASNMINNTSEKIGMGSFSGKEKFINKTRLYFIKPIFRDVRKK